MDYYYYFKDGAYKLTDNCNACGENLQKTKKGLYHHKTKTNVVLCPICGEEMEMISAQDRATQHEYVGWLKKTNPSFALLGDRKYEEI